MLNRSVFCIVLLFSSLATADVGILTNITNGKSTPPFAKQINISWDSVNVGSIEEQIIPCAGIGKPFEPTAVPAQRHGSCMYGIMTFYDWKYPYTSQPNSIYGWGPLVIYVKNNTTWREAHRQWVENFGSSGTNQYNQLNPALDASSGLCFGAGIQATGTATAPPWSLVQGCIKPPPTNISCTYNNDNNGARIDIEHGSLSSDNVNGNIRTMSFSVICSAPVGLRVSFPISSVELGGGIKSHLTLRVAGDIYRNNELIYIKDNAVLTIESKLNVATAPSAGNYSGSTFIILNME